MLGWCVGAGERVFWVVTMKGHEGKLRLYPAVTQRIERLGRRGQVLQGVWAGKTTKEIAADLGLSPRTVDCHRAQLYRVFGVSNAVSLCRRALEERLIGAEVGRGTAGQQDHGTGPRGKAGKLKW
jgi:DNA-binding CsgD family transcriptional regulator